MERLYLIAYLGAQALAIDSDQVESVVDLGDITPVPKAGSTVRGLAALRSRVVTVLSVRAALGLDPDEDNRRAVIVRADGHHYALIVDAIEDIIALEMAPLPSSMPFDAAWRRVAIGIVTRNGEPILTIDPARLIPESTAIAA